MNPQPKTMLCLGDSYTIGQSVAEDQRFPSLTRARLEQEGIHFKTPEIIAKTGWTTADLTSAINKNKPATTFDAVTLLAGVNDQYRGYDTAVYASQFESLLKMAIGFANGKKQHVFVLSIPDYSVTPFAANLQKTPVQISKELVAFNTINKRLAQQYDVHYIDITPISKLALQDAGLLANDKLHPSGKMYAMWAELLAGEMKEVYQ